MQIDLSNLNALVCGGSKGIGKATAILLAACGAEITVVARDIHTLESVITQLPRPKNQHHQFLVIDLNNIEDVKRKIHALALTKTVDIIINNTGGPPAGQAHLAQIEEYEMAFRQHLMANQIIVQGLLEGMKSKKFGRIINVISTSVKQPLENLGVSNTIRGAVANWAKTLSNELGQYNITVNNVLPGATETERLQQIIAREATAKSRTEEEIARHMKANIPLARFAKPEEIASAIAFLASPLAGYITGINLPVDGGRTKSL